MKHKALIKDLELQIDYLVGYAPQGNHWKQEYYLRKELIESVLQDKSTPDNIVDKIIRIQAKLYDLKQGIKTNQDYLKHTEVPKITHQVKVKDVQGNITYFSL